ncbi:MAG TPA: DUF4280 domain-containing protein [Herpetosiphonaceae bacterium]
MGMQVCMGATLQCSFGVAPSTLVVLPQNAVLTTTPAANIMDNKPIANVPPFGMCQSMANPAVAAATAAAMGALTPMPCMPVLTAPWIVGSPTVLLANMPTLSSDSKLICAFGGVIQVVNPGQVTVQLG